MRCDILGTVPLFFHLINSMILFLPYFKFVTYASVCIGYNPLDSQIFELDPNVPLSKVQLVSQLNSCHPLYTPVFWHVVSYYIVYKQ